MRGGEAAALRLHQINSAGRALRLFRLSVKPHLLQRGASPTSRPLSAALAGQACRNISGLATASGRERWGSSRHLGREGRARHSGLRPPRKSCVAAASAIRGGDTMPREEGLRGRGGVPSATPPTPQAVRPLERQEDALAAGRAPACSNGPTLDHRAPSAIHPQKTRGGLVSDIRFAIRPASRNSVSSDRMAAFRSE
jgi:hypothetical protein